ncbi:MAG: WhiB family transcriptional regulator [Acidimicrobiales bacterium]|nr:WhiB family transcriptional regulator [Acidimicrobiales bacterium]
MPIAEIVGHPARNGAILGPFRPAVPVGTLHPGRIESTPLSNANPVLHWRRQAACKGLDPSIFFPSDDDDECLDAKSVCEQCPVVDLCLEHALGLREKEGVWGGCTERERRRIIRQRRRSA